MRKTTKPATPTDLATPRSIERLRPGQWWLGEYEDDDGQPLELWAEVDAVLSWMRTTSGERLTEIRGIATDGGSVRFIQLSGFGVEQTLTAAQARRAGLRSVTL